MDIDQSIKDLAAAIMDLELRLRELDERHQLQIDELLKRMDARDAALEKANDPTWTMRCPLCDKEINRGETHGVGLCP